MKTERHWRRRPAQRWQSWRRETRSRSSPDDDSSRTASAAAPPPTNTCSARERTWASGRSRPADPWSSSSVRYWAGLDVGIRMRPRVRATSRTWGRQQWPSQIDWCLPDSEPTHRRPSSAPPLQHHHTHRLSQLHRVTYALRSTTVGSTRSYSNSLSLSPFITVYTGDWQIRLLNDGLTQSYFQTPSIKATLAKLPTNLVTFKGYKIQHTIYKANYKISHAVTTVTNDYATHKMIARFNELTSTWFNEDSTAAVNRRAGAWAGGKGALASLPFQHQGQVIWFAPPPY